MLPAKVALTRTELYEKVWSKSMRTIAKEFGISDVGLAKLCRRHEIPLPGRGYWARIQFGQKPEKSALPPASDPSLDAITIHRSEPKSRGNPRPTWGEDIPTILVAADRQITHSLVNRIERSISRKRTDERGFLLTNAGRTVPLKICEKSLTRALRILDSLFAALDEAKYVLEWPKPYNALLKIVTQGEKLQLLITEAIQRKEHKPTSEELSRQKSEMWWRPNQWEYTPTNKLKVTLESCEFSSIRYNWADGKRRKLEDCLGEVFVACEKIAASVKKERVNRAEAEIRRREEEKRRTEEAIRKAEYDRKATALTRLASAWKEAQLLRDFARALQSTVTSADLPEKERLETEAMAEWSLHHADYVDPLTDIIWTINEFNDPPWHYGD